MEPFRSPRGVTVLCFCLTILLNNGASTQHAQLFGGSMSFEIEKSGKDFMAKIKVLTAWKIGTGPCGTGCNYTAIERSTATVRQDLLNKYGPEYLGIWQGETGVYGISTSRNYVNMTPEVNSHIIEKVQLLNMGLHWEMDQADINATISQGTDYMDMKFIGKYWVQSTVSQNVVPPQEMWMQTKIRTAVRSDTKMSNRSPVLQIKPYQRFLINKITTISVNYIDQDDDIVRCEFSSYGTGNGIKTPKGLSMNKADCIIKFDVSGSEYKVGDTGLILVDVMDFNKQDVVLESGNHREIFAAGDSATARSLSAVPLQFYFEVVDHLNEPEFIDPTPPNSQHYEIYSGAAFTVNIFAKPTDNSSTTEIDQFLLTRRDGIHVDKSLMAKRPELGPRVQTITLKWTPKQSEAGKHLVCSYVVDTLGNDSPLRCFSIIVKDMPLKPLIPLKGKPYFLHFPANKDIVCQVDSVCKFPLYASTDNPGGIINILIIRKELFKLKREGQLKTAPTNIASKAWMIEVSFQDPRHGEKQFCAKAIDKFASIEQCTIIHVKPRDPCLSSPCQNSGECIAKKDGTAQCFCKHGASGERCQHRPDPCDDKHFCKNGGTCISGGYCVCPLEVTGMNCENVFSSCDQNVCPGNGMCIDTPGGKQDHECLCTNLYTGQQCATNPFPFIDCIITPNDPKCVSCNMLPNPCNTGKCKMHNGSHTCICSEGFVGKDCQTAIDSTRGSSNSKFVSPTLAPGSIIKCDPLSGLTGGGLTANCEFPVYVFWNGGLPREKPVVEQKFISKDMKLDSRSKALLKFLQTSTTEGFNKTLTAIVRLVNPDNQMFQTGMHVVCLVVKKGTVETDHRCFSIDVEFEVLKVHRRLTKGDGRVFESPTLPGGSEIVCVKDKFCHINLYTEHKPSPDCLQPVFQSDAPCTVFGPVQLEFYQSEAGKVCHSDIAYSTGGLAVGTKKDVCFQASQDGETRCFQLHIIANSKDPCSSDPCQNDGLCVALSDGTHSCICKLGFYGNSCEIGSCPATMANQQYCQNDGHCHTDSIKKTCFCRLGSIGSQCGHKTTESLTNPATSGAKFIGSSLPTTIKCHLGDPCEIPSVLTGDPNVKPSMKKGFVDSSVEVQGMNVTQDKNSTHVYHTVTTILPKKTGNHKVCVQNVNAVGQTADELCYSIEVTAELPKPVSDRKPQFISPTLPDGSSIECSVGKACHMILWIKSQVYNPNCPLVESDMKAPDGIFVFQSDTDPSPCSTDVSIHTDIERTISVCFTLITPPDKNGQGHGGEGEKRCYSIMITKETLHARGPCSRLICMNQGFCNGKGNTGFCQCPSGYSGTTCQVAHGNSLTAPHSQPGAKTGDHVLPQKVVCVLHEECSIPFTVTSSAQPPSVRPGHTEAGLSSKGTTIIPDPKHPGTFLSHLNVVGTTPGVHKTCIQTGDTKETTSDEFCFEVEVKSPDSYHHEVKTSQPYFITPTIPHDSVTQCVPGKSCHVLLFMSGSVYPECPSIEQTQGPTDDLHLFTSADNSKLIGNCTADVTFTPPLGSTGKYRFCFKTFLPNIPGEIRCFYVKYMDYTAPSHSCIGTSCLDGSVCDVINGQPMCICALLQSGQNCQQAGSSGTPHTSSQPTITDLPLPKVIRCEVGTFCVIPTLVNGDINNPPTVTTPSSNPNMIPAPPSIHKDNKYPKGTYKVDGLVKVTKEGIYEQCMIIKNGGKNCFKIEAFNNKNSTQATSNVNGHFVTPSLPPDSTVVCKPTTTCHLTLYQHPQNHTCVPAVGEIVPGGAYIVSPSSLDDSGFCETDIIYKPTTGAKSQKVCVRAKGANNSDGELRCFKIDPSLNDTNPCHTAMCHTGDCVLTVDGDVECKCHIGTTGKTCDQDTKNLITGHTVSGKPGFVDTVKPKKIVCYTGQPCGIPVAVNSNGGQSTKVRVKEVPPKDLTLKPIPGTNISQAVVQAESTNPANLTKCVAVIESGQEKDTLCYNIEFKPGPAPSQNGSNFTKNSLGPNSEVYCETGVVCHLIVETSQQGGVCPNIKSTNPSVQGDKISDVYVFDPKESTVNSKIKCTTDVAIKPSATEAGRKEVCVTIEKSSRSQSDTRCYKVFVKRGDACKPVECLNGGICKSVDNYEGIAVCVCPLGYSGNRCQNKKDNSVTPFTEEGIPAAEKTKGAPRFTATSLPETIHCVLDQSCHLPLRVTDPTGNTPVIGFGQVDPGIITSPPTVTPSGSNTYTTDVEVTPTKLGKRRVCVQTKNTENVNMDEVCYNIETSEKNSPGQGSPKFTEPTVSENSVVVCQPGQTCHIPLTYETSNNNCEKVTETSYITEVHIFQGSSPVGNTCAVDVGFTPTPDAGGTQHMCFKPGSNGEKRCIMVKIQDTSSLSSTPCQAQHCHRDGFCSVPSGTQAVCTCRLGSTGPICQTDSTLCVVPVTGSASQEPNFVDTVVPREVKCYKGRECLIPFAVKGNSQSVEVGDHDNGMNTMIKPGTKITSTDGVYEHILSVIPQTSEGKKEMCVKTKTGKEDQICFTVDVVDPPTDQGTTPDFIGTTLGPDSTVECQTETLCHVQIQTNQTNGECPAILENTDKTSISDVHIFPSQTQNCTTDIVLKPRVTETGQKQLCVHFNAGTVSKQEDKERCFKVTVSNTIDPCVPVYCMNNGECQINNGKGECICPSGFTGSKCQTVKSEKVTAVNLGVLKPAQEQPHFTKTAVPKIIKCVQDMPCHLPLTVTDPSGKKPSVKFGKVDPGIDTEKPVLTPINGTKDFTTDITITPQEPGTKTLCVQTQTSQGMNVDEICYQIQTSGSNSSTRPSPDGHPAFTAPTVTDSSTLLCEIGEICHIPLTYEGLKGTCEEVNELPTHTAGVHIFKPPVQPTAVDKSCTSEIAYKPSTPGPTKLCFKPGTYGEKRCINIEGEPTGKKLSTPCQSLHCKNRGECIADNQGTAKCVCTLGTSGVDCSQGSSNFITDRVNKTKPGFIDTVLPQTIVCYKLEKCTVPFLVTSTGGIPPTVVTGQIDPDLVATGPSTPTQIKSTDSFKTKMTLTPTDNGEKLACVQTHDSSGKTVDEICTKVNVIDHPKTSATTLPGFTEKTFKPGSLLGCKVDQDCHLPMETTTNTKGKCPTLSRDIPKTTIQDVHPLETLLCTIDNTCQTDVVIHPNNTEIGIHKVCIQINVSPSEEPRCYLLNVTESMVTTSTFTTTIATTLNTKSSTEKAATTSMETTITTTLSSLKTTKVAATTNNTKTTKTKTLAAPKSNKTIQGIATSNNPKAAATTDNTKTTKAAAKIKTITMATASTYTTITGKSAGNKTLKGVATTVINAKTNIAATTIHSTKISTLAKTNDKTTRMTLSTSNGKPTNAVTTAGSKTTEMALATSNGKPTNAVTAAGSKTTEMALATSNGHPSKAVTSAGGKIPTLAKPNDKTSKMASSTINGKLTNAVTTAGSKTATLAKPNDKTSKMASSTIKGKLTNAVTAAGSKTTTLAKPNGKTTKMALATSNGKPTTAASGKTATLAKPNDKTSKMALSSINGKSTNAVTTAGSKTTTLAKPNDKTTKMASSTINGKLTNAVTTAGSKTTKMALPTTNGNPTKAVSTASGKATTLAAATRSKITKTAATTNTNNALETTLINYKRTKGSTINAKTMKGSTDSCNQMTAAQALEAAQMGRVSCYCMVNGTRREIIKSNPKASTEQLLKAAGIGAGSTSGAMVIAWLIYMLVSKVKGSAQNKLPPTPRPRKVKPSRRKSLGSAFT